MSLQGSTIIEGTSGTSLIVSNVERISVVKVDVKSGTGVLLVEDAVEITALKVEFVINRIHHTHVKLKQWLLIN